MFRRKRKDKSKEESSLLDVRGQSLVELLQEHAPHQPIDCPPRRPRGRSQHYQDSDGGS